MGDLHRLAEGLLGRRRVPEIAFEIDDAGGAHRVRFHVVGGEVLAGAEIGVHGALAVRRHQDEAARGGGAVLGGRDVVMDVDGLQVVREELAGLVVLHLADEARLHPEGGSARRRVGAGAAGHDGGGAHVPIELLGALLVDELMAPLCTFFCSRKASSVWASTSTMALPSVSTSMRVWDMSNRIAEREGALSHP